MAGSVRMLMMLWSWGVIAFGVVLMGGGFASTNGASQKLLAVLGSVTPTFDAPLRFAVGLMGAVTFGWGLTVLAVASVSDQLALSGLRLLWQRISWAIFAWYVVDCTISVATGFSMNALPNTILFVAFLLILWRSNVSNRPSGDRQGGIA